MFVVDVVLDKIKNMLESSIIVCIQVHRAEQGPGGAESMHVSGHHRERTGVCL